MRQPQRGDTHEREQRWEPVPCDDPSKASACQLRQMDGHQNGLAAGLARLAPPRTYGRRRAGPRRCKLDALAKRCQTNTSSPQTFPGARLARGTAANELCSPASGAVPACLAQLACQGMTEMTSGPSYVLPGSIATTTANCHWDIYLHRPTRRRAGKNSSERCDVRACARSPSPLRRLNQRRSGEAPHSSPSLLGTHTLRRWVGCGDNN